MQERTKAPARDIRTDISALAPALPIRDAAAVVILDHVWVCATCGAHVFDEARLSCHGTCSATLTVIEAGELTDDGRFLGFADYFADRPVLMFTLPQKSLAAYAVYARLRAVGYAPWRAVTRFTLEDDEITIDFLTPVAAQLLLYLAKRREAAQAATVAAMAPAPETEAAA